MHKLSFIATTESGTEYAVVEGEVYRNNEHFGQYLGAFDHAVIAGVLREDPTPQLGAGIAIRRKDMPADATTFFGSTELVFLELT